MAGRGGNPAALIRWYNDGAGGQISWGQPGDFEQCVKIAGQYVDDPEAFCQERHLDATGEPAGHAAGERASMSTLSKKQRDALPEADFGDPQRRLFPILDQNDVDSAARLIGKAVNPEAVKTRIIAIARRKKLAIPDAWQEKASMSIDFALRRPVVRFDGEMVIRRGKIFEAGDYPDKQFSITPEELLAVERDFRPIPIDSGHPEAPSPLDGRMGELRALRLADDGWSVEGEVALPRWLADLVPDDLPVSLAWSRETKQPLRLSLVSEPRVADAMLLAAFARAQQGGQTVTAVAPAFAAPGRIDTRVGREALQKIHDLAHPHALADTTKGPGSSTYDPLTPGPAVPSATPRDAADPTANDKDLTPPQTGLGPQGRSPQASDPTQADKVYDVPSRHEVNSLKSIHDLSVQHGALCTAAGANSPALAFGRAGGNGRKRMGLRDWFFRRGIEQARAEGAIDSDEEVAEFAASLAGVPAQPAPPPPAGLDEMTQARIQRLEAELAASNEREIAIEAAAFARRMVDERRALPADEAAIVAQFCQAAADDRRLAAVNFAVDGAQTRLDSVRAVWQHRPQHVLTQELVPGSLPPGAVVFANQQTTARGDEPKDTTPEAIERLLGTTALGRAALRERANGRH